MEMETVAAYFKERRVYITVKTVEGFFHLHRSAYRDEGISPYGDKSYRATWSFLPQNLVRFSPCD